MMNRFALVLVMLATLAFYHAAMAQEKKSDRVFEMRTYIANEGKFEAMQARFREHAVRLFKKHGIEIVGFWVPLDQEKSKNTMVYMLAFDSVEAMKQKWDGFRRDPEWLKIKADSEKDGALVGKVISEVLKGTDYSPMK